MPGLREFIISPVLVHTLPLEQYETRRHELGIGEPSSETGNPPPTTSNSEFSAIRSHKVLDSALSGVVTGGFLRSLKCRLSFLLRRSRRLMPLDSWPKGSVVWCNHCWCDGHTTPTGIQRVQRPTPQVYLSPRFTRRCSAPDPTSSARILGRSLGGCACARVDLMESEGALSIRREEVVGGRVFEETETPEGPPSEADRRARAEAGEREGGERKCRLGADTHHHANLYHHLDCFTLLDYNYNCFYCYPLLMPM